MRKTDRISSFSILLFIVLLPLLSFPPAVAAGLPGDAPESASPPLLDRLGAAADKADERFSAFGANIANVPGDVAKALGSLAREQGAAFLVKIFALCLLVVFLGLAIERLAFARLVRKGREEMAQSGPMPLAQRFWSAVFAMLMLMLRLALFLAVCGALFVLPIGGASPAYRFALVSILLAVVAYRLLSGFFRVLLSPAFPALRLFPIRDETARSLYLSGKAFSLLIAVGYTFCYSLLALGLPVDSFIFVGLFFMTALCLVLALPVWKYRKAVAEKILESGGGAPSPLRRQFASLWQVLAIAYLVILYGVSCVRLIITRDTQFHGMFYLSLLSVPAYLLLDSFGQWVVGITSKTLVRQAPAEPADGGRAAQKTHYYLWVKKAVRALIAFSLAVMLLEIWGLRLPFAEAMVRAVFNILVTLLLANLAWSAICGAIDRRLAGEEDEADEEEEESEGDWGGSKAADRSQTILPRVRTFLGAVLLTAVVMIVLSSMGVEIGPLLAGAGVAGIAIGFGAQKVVADVISGIFFLVDDAFRIGEYIEAGSAAGVVEGMTLRNLMLRHSRGMLQIIPYSELGSVTNYMRGGIVEKFSLELPYDTDIDVVRKVVKKVGQKMMEDPEFAEDFIKPIKSQGVREVANSVMVFRVKFTARPGRQFVIRREAFRRVTEALGKKGIHFAHRKVLVDIPQAENPEEALKAAGAAAMQAVMQEEAEKAEAEAKKK